METIKLVYPVEGGDMIEAGEASSKMKLTLKKLGLPQDVIRRASICMYEGEINMVIHADGGTATVDIGLRHHHHPGRPRPWYPRHRPGYAGRLHHRRRGGPGPGLRRGHGPAQHEEIQR